MTNYIEEFTILNRRYGIEDYKSPGDHFMQDKATHRYQLWAGGCGVDNADSLKEARDKLFSHVISDVTAKKDKAIKDLHNSIEAIEAIYKLRDAICKSP